jgi:Na+-driven multidrug efflux pump
LAHIGQNSLAAGAIVAWTFGTIYVILFGILSSINVLIAHKHGAKDIKGISLIVRDGLWLAVLLSLPSFLLFWNLASLLAMAGQSPIIEPCYILFACYGMGAITQFYRIGGARGDDWIRTRAPYFTF